MPRPKSATRKRTSRKAQAVWRDRIGKEGRAERRRLEEARCYDWARILPLVRKEPDTGCWIWTGAFRAAYGVRVRPVMRVGAFAKMYVDKVVWEMFHEKGIPHACFLARSCDRLECVAPAHLLLSNLSVERAKARLARREEANDGKEALRARAGRDESGDHRRGG